MKGGEAGVYSLVLEGRVGAMGRTWEVLGDPGESCNRERVNLGKFNWLLDR